MRTFSIQTLGCKVNQYESDQIATLLRSRGLEQVDFGGDLRIVNSCSVTIQAASKSRQAARRAVRLPVLSGGGVGCGSEVGGREIQSSRPTTYDPQPTFRPKVVLTGCWATSNPEEASRITGVDAVLGHHDDVAAELHRLMDRWTEESRSPEEQTTAFSSSETTFIAKPVGDEGSIKAGASPGFSDVDYTHSVPVFVKKNPREAGRQAGQGTRSLPLLNQRQNGHQRAMLKIQDGCDAHCTYCIIPQLRPMVWSKPIEDVIAEAQRLVEAGHREIVLTGIFLGAYGQPTALRRRQCRPDRHPMSEMISAICTEVPGIHRLRFSSLEPGDLTDSLIERMRQYPQIVPHFHLPLQSGSDALLHRMNRQYTRNDFRRMIERVNAAFDRPAITTDIIVGFPGETDQEFERTVEMVNEGKFIHIHAFSFSPRPGTAAARWKGDFVDGPVVIERIERLNELAQLHSLEFRRRFIGERVEVLVERKENSCDPVHGRCERYFDVKIEGGGHLSAGDAAAVRITRVTWDETIGELIA